MTGPSKHSFEHLTKPPISARPVQRGGAPPGVSRPDEEAVGFASLAIGRSEPNANPLRRCALGK